MSLSNSITKLLNFKENNLIFDENFFESRTIKNKKCFIIKGYLFNNYEYCPKCGCINENTIITKGIDKCLIKINKISEMTSYLELNKQIYKCKNTLNTLKKYSKYIKNTLEYSYSNGVMERNNNTCKLIKRISFGFRNFRNMKSRIMIITNIFRKEKREYHTKYSIPKYA